MTLSLCLPRVPGLPELYGEKMLQLREFAEHRAAVPCTGRAAAPAPLSCTGGLLGALECGMRGEQRVQGCPNCSNSPQVTGEAIAKRLYVKLCKDIIALYAVEQPKLHFITPSAGFLPANGTRDVSVPARVCPQRELSA